MSQNNTFKTKSGICQILPDKIVLSREGITGAAAKATSSQGISPLLFLYAAIALGLLYLAFNSYRHELQFQAIVFFAVGIFLVFEVISSFNLSTATNIKRKNIKRVLFKKGIPWITRSRFEVFFQNEKGQTKKRLIMLPGSLKEGRKESEKAVEIMKKEKLI